MGYKPGPKEKHRDLETVSGRKIFVDSYGRAWLLKAVSIRELNRFAAPLGALITQQNALNWLVFLAANLWHTEPGLWIRFRRALGLCDFSPRFISKHFPAKDRKKVRDALVLLNLDEDFDTYIKRIDEAVKKKMIAPEPTGAN